MKLALPTVTLLALLLVACAGESGDGPARSDASGDIRAGDNPVIDDQPFEDVPPATAPMPSQGADARAHFGGYGALRFGMNADEVRQAWDGELNGAPGPDQVCYHLRPMGRSTAAGVALMIEDDRFVRYSIADGNDNEAAPGGGKRGMSADRIRALYSGRIEEQPHKYVQGGKYLRVADDASGSLLIFESDAAGAITGWRVGMPPQVEYVEGCS